MKKAIIYDAIKLLFLFGALWALFTYLPIFPHSSDSLTVSIATEEKIGNLLTSNVLENEKQVQNPGTHRIDRF
jgi:hypothetical protein